MEIKTVQTMPLSSKGMNEKLQQLIQTFTDMKENEILEIEDTETTPLNLKNRVKTATRRIPSAKFKARTINNKIYVQKLSDMIPPKEDTNENEQTEEETETPKNKKNKRK